MESEGRCVTEHLPRLHDREEGKRAVPHASEVESDRRHTIERMLNVGRPKALSSQPMIVSGRRANRESVDLGRK